MVEIKLKNLETRCINGYGPQENDKLEKKTKFWKSIGEEVEDALDNDKALVLQMDGNLHAGPEVIPGDTYTCIIN